MPAPHTCFDDAVGMPAFTQSFQHGLVYAIITASSNSIRGKSFCLAFLAAMVFTLGMEVSLYNRDNK